METLEVRQTKALEEIAKALTKIAAILVEAIEEDKKAHS